MRKVWEPLHSREQTGRQMYNLVARFSGDLQRITTRKNGKNVPLASLTLGEYHSFVRRLPYKRDDKPVEVIARPRIALSRVNETGGIDCKKKGILMGAWFAENGFPAVSGFRFVAVSTKPNRAIHHVMPQVNIGGAWLNADATYSNQRLFSPKRVTKYEVLKP